MNRDEPRNFFMIVHLVMDIGAWISRKIFLKEAPVHTLSSRFQNVLTNRVHRKNFNRKQLELIQEVPPEPEKFDISLTVGLIRLICPGIPPPANGWDNPPDLTDTSTAADLKRLLDIRNNKLHSSSASLGYFELKELWNMATETIKRLARGISPELEKNVQDKIEEIKSKWSGMSAGDVLRLQEIFESQREAYDYMEHSNQMIDQIHKMLTDHCTGLACPSIQVIENNTAADIPNTTRLSNSEPREEIQPQEHVTKEEDYCDRVTFIKVYPWIKKELNGDIAKYLFKELQPTEILNKRRKIVIDQLLKYVLKSQQSGYVRMFVNKLFDKQEGFEDEWKRNSNSTKEEIDEYKQLNELHHQPRDLLTNLFNLDEHAQNQISFFLKDFHIIDNLNDSFLASFYYGLFEHDGVCDYLKRDDYGGALQQLFTVMKKCPMTIKKCFCETLTRIEEYHHIAKFMQEIDEQNPGIPSSIAEAGMTPYISPSTGDPLGAPIVSGYLQTMHPSVPPPGMQRITGIPSSIAEAGMTPYISPNMGAPPGAPPASGYLQTMYPSVPPPGMQHITGTPSSISEAGMHPYISSSMGAPLGGLPEMPFITRIPSSITDAGMHTYISSSMGAPLGAPPVSESLQTMHPSVLQPGMQIITGIPLSLAEAGIHRYIPTSMGSPLGAPPVSGYFQTMHPSVLQSGMQLITENSLPIFLVIQPSNGPIYLQFYPVRLEFGSIWFYLKSDSRNEWDLLKEKCITGDVTEVLYKVIADNAMFRLFPGDRYTLFMSIYKEEQEAANDTVEETLVLKIDIKDDKLHHREDTADANISPISSHNRLLCEEMDITDDLIEQLQMENIVAGDMREQLETIRSRAGRINHLLTHIREPEKGYEIIKDYQKSKNPFLYKELCKKDQRQLLFKCEAKIQLNAQTAGSVSESDRNFTWKIISSSCFFDSKDKPDAPSTPECKGTTTDSIALSWKPPGNNGGSLITGYRLEKREKGDNKWSKCSSADIPDYKFTVKGLQEGKEYDFRVAAVNKAGVGDFAETEKAIKAQTPILASKVIPRDITAKKVQPFKLRSSYKGIPIPTASWPLVQSKLDVGSPLKTYQKDWTEFTTKKSTLEQETVPTKADFKSLTEPKLKPGLQIPKVLRGIKSYDTNEIIETLGTWDKDKSLCQNYMCRIESILQQADKEKNWTQMEPLVNKLDTLKKKWEEQSDSLPSCCQELESFRTSAGLMISLGHLAFNLLFGKSTSYQQKLVFPKQECKKYLSDEELNVCLSIGILSKSPTFRGIREIDSYSFSRKSVQEFLSALWLAGPGADRVGRITEGISEETGSYSFYRAVDNVELLLKFLSGLGPQVAAEPLQYIYTQGIKYCDTSHINQLILSCCAESQHCNNTKHIYFTFPEIVLHWETMSDDDIRMWASIVEASSSCLRRLAIVGLTLRHESVEEPSDISSSHSSIDTLYQSLNCCGNLEYLRLVNISCSDHRHDNISSVLDIHNHHKLEELTLLQLSVRTVLWPPVTISCLRGLYIKHLKLTHECVEELCRTYEQYRQLEMKYCEVSRIFCVDHRTLCHSFEDLQKHINL